MIGSLVFSETVVRGPCFVAGERGMFFEKNLLAPKMEKMGQKWTKIGFFKFIGKFSH